MFNHFENNLRSSNTLIVIGYGFGDDKINEFIERDFLTDDMKTLFVVDRADEKELAATAQKLLDRKSSFYSDGGVSEMDKGFIIEKMNP